MGWRFHPSLAAAVTNAQSPGLEPHIARMTLESFAQLATVVTLMILVYVQAKPAVNRWATIRYLRCCYEFFDDFFVTPKEYRHSSWTERLRHAARLALRYFALFLMPRADQSRLGVLLPQLSRERQRPQHLPPLDGCDPLVAEALFVSRHHLEDRRARVHKRVVCAGGCGTRFGKRRRDHDFLGGEGIHGGWLCPTTPCKGQSTGDHYCGMCLEELQQASGARRVPDAKVVPIDLDAHPEHPDLQDY